MIATYRKLKERRAAEGVDEGFTLIELLIVIIVLGILAAVVVFSLGSVTGKSAVAACQADGATVNTAMAAFTAQNPTIPPTSGNLTSSALGGPYLQSWPNNTTHYKFQIASGVLQLALPGSSTWTNWKGAGTCVTVGVS
jgi:prepilin-type N-terminal cleavage/methylation domain-containing protein